ncbi:MAG: DNA replication/repair protein RecF [Simkania negevensis]|nr:DNA replication/repair protein RecF [Simkania negevensis]
MFLKKLLLIHFRNYQKEELVFKAGINLLSGANGAGKTSILEAIYLLSTGRSFRTNHLFDLIQKGASSFHVAAEFEKDGVEQTLSISFDGESKQMQYNDTSFASYTPLLGVLPSVLSSPKDIEILSGSPKERRRFLNLHIAQADPLYVYHLVRFQKGMQHRNVLLKRKKEETMATWEQMMAPSAAYIIKKREQLLSQLALKIKRFTTLFSEGEDLFTLTYAPSLPFKGEIKELLNAFAMHRSKELFFGTTLFGPHRDDMQIFFDTKEAKSYASEGQKRTFILSLKFAEWESLAEISGSSPFMSFDDFGIHLDEKRKEVISQRFSNFRQIFLTLPTLASLPSLKISHHLVIRNGCVSPA